MSTAKIFLIGLALVIASAPSALAIGHHPSKTFLKNAIRTDQDEAALCRLALQTSIDPEIKDFAQQVLNDHAAFDQQVAPLAASHGVATPTDAAAKPSKAAATLEGRTGKDFDMAFVQEFVDGEFSLIESLRTPADTELDPDVRTFAAAVLRQMQRRLRLARALNPGRGN